MNCIIIDDENHCIKTLSNLLETYFPQVNILASCNESTKAYDLIQHLRPEFVFLDIEMPFLNGFDLLSKFEHLDFDVIFTTAYDSYAIKAIKYSALDYLLKPIIPQDLADAVQRVEKKKAENNRRKSFEDSSESLRMQERQSHKIVLSTSDMIHVINVDEIVRCESDNYYTNFYFVDGRKLLISKTLKENEELLSPFDFIRPHKSHLVNIKYIKSFLRQEGGYILMHDGTLIPVSRRKKDKIMEIIYNL